MPKSIRQMMTVGCFARSLEDLRLCFSVIAGADPQQPDVPPVPLGTPASKAIEDLNIAWITHWEAIPVFSEIRAAVGSVAARLSQAGATVQPWPTETLDLAELFQVCNQVTAFNNVYAQPSDWPTARRALSFMFREATQGIDRAVGDFHTPPMVQSSHLSRD